MSTRLNLCPDPVHHDAGAQVEARVFLTAALAFSVGMLLGFALGAC